MRPFILVKADRRALFCLVLAALLAGAGSSLAFQVGSAAVFQPRFTTANPSAPAGPMIVDLNRAGRDELVGLPGIGPVLARRIIDYRRLNGPFTTREDLRRVKGIGPKIFSRIKDRVKP
jgi:competence ComEA-like helix-hairpin-helix protein